MLRLWIWVWQLFPHHLKRYCAVIIDYYHRHQSKEPLLEGLTNQEDLAMIASMIADIKERSEHRMLVDLMRNDLSSICKVGTVNIAQFDVESYANVHHLVSHINGKYWMTKPVLMHWRQYFPEAV